MTHETAKQKYRETSKMRGSDPEAIKKVAAEKLRLVKARSFCAGCKRRGHWHKDPECPLNQGRTREGTGGTGSPNKPPATGGNGGAPPKPSGPRDNFPCHVVHVTWDIEQDKAGSFQAITDTACSKTVAGAPWMDAYFVAAKKAGFEPEIYNARDAFRFGASKVFESAYAVVVSFGLGNSLVKIRVCVVNGDVPLLLSRTVLGELGMILDVAKNQADFRNVGVEGLKLDVTETGHPALSVRPELFCGSDTAQAEWKSAEIQIIPKRQQYTVFAAAAECVSPGSSTVHVPADVHVQASPSSGPSNQRLFFPKKIGKATLNMFLGDSFCAHAFVAWWEGTNITNDFWVEGPHSLVRVHVIPRRTFFEPDAWSTPHADHKQALLEILGEVRNTWGISCKDRRELSSQHDLWKSVTVCPSYATLWIGRTVFARKPMRPCNPLPLRGENGPEEEPDDRAGDDPSEGALGAHQGRVTGGGPSTGLMGESQMDGTRNSRDDQGRHGPRGLGDFNDYGSPAPRSLEHVFGAAHDDGRGPQREGPSGKHEGCDLAPDQGQCRRRTPAGHDVRALQGLPLHGNPDELPAMGDLRSDHQQDGLGGSHPLRGLVQGPPGAIHPAPALRGSGRPRAECDGSLHPGRVRGSELGAVGPGGPSSETLDGGEGKGNCRVSATPPYRMSSEAGSRREMQTDVGPDVLDEICHLETRLAVIRDRHGLPRAPGAGEDNHQ